MDVYTYAVTGCKRKSNVKNVFGCGENKKNVTWKKNDMGIYISKSDIKMYIEIDVMNISHI